MKKILQNCYGYYDVLNDLVKSIWKFSFRSTNMTEASHHISQTYLEAVYGI